jgi:hypothetical protein
MRSNQIRNTFLIACVIAITSGMEVGCTVGLPNGKILCDFDHPCPTDPTDWTCIEGLCWKPDATVNTGQTVSYDDSGTDANSSDSGGSDADAQSGAGGAGGTDAQSGAGGAGGTDAQSGAGGVAGACGSIDCKDKCGPIQGCECGPCQSGFQCSSTGTCVCDGCNIDGKCYKKDSKNPQNPCQVCLPKTPSKWSPNPSNTKVKCGSKVPGNEACTQDVYCDGEKCPLPNMPDGTKCNGTPITVCEVQDVCEKGVCVDKGFRESECLDGSGKTGEGPCYYKNRCVNGQCVGQPKEENAACTPEGNARPSECAVYKCTLGSCNASYPGSSKSCTFQDTNGQRCDGRCDVYGNCQAASGSGTCSEESNSRPNPGQGYPPPP